MNSCLKRALRQGLHPVGNVDSLLSPVPFERFKLFRDAGAEAPATERMRQLSRLMGAAKESMKDTGL